MEIDLSQIISQIIAFLVMLWVLRRYAFGPLMAIMQERQKKIEAEVDTIRQQRSEVEGLIERYQGKLHEIDAEGRKRMQQEIAKGREAASEIQKEANKKAEALLKKAEESIKQEVEKAKVQLKKEIIDMVVVTAEKVLDAKLDTSEKQNIVVEHFADKAKLK